jgi:hypothetical protein
MRTNKQILLEAYLVLAKRVTLWAGLVAMAVSVLVVPSSAGAATQLTARKATVSYVTTAGLTANAAFSFTFGSSYTVQGITVDLCTTPIAGACTQPTGGDLTTASATLGSPGAQCASFAESAKTATRYSLNFATGQAVTSASTCTFTINGFTVPTTANAQYYFRVTTWTNSTYTTPAGGQDFGGIAESTGQIVTVTATVQEDLKFCVGSGATNNAVTACSSPGAGTVALSPNPMGTGAPSTGTMLMAAATNAASGYVVNYIGSTFVDANADTIAAAGTSAVAAAGTEKFGVTLNAQTSGVLNTFGAAPSNGIGAASGNYN